MVEAFIERLHAKLERNLPKIIQYEEYYLEDTRVGIVAFGSTARTALGAVEEARSEGLPVGLLKLKTIWPFPEEKVAELGQRMHLVVAELNRGQLVREVERVAKDVSGLHRYDGEPMQPHQILDRVRALL